MGVICTYPHALVHRPWQYTRFNLPNLHMEQIIIQVLMVLKYGTQLVDMMGILLRASMEDMTLKMGLQGNIFNIPIKFHHLVTDSWIKNV